MIETLDLATLRSFVSIVELGSFSKAASRHFRTQAAISQQIRRLEALLRTSLLERHGKQVRPTLAGDALLAKARALLAAHDALVAAVREPELEGRVRLGTPEDFATTHLSTVLAAFAEAHPRVALDVSCDLTLHLQAAFQRGAFDLVLLKRDPAPTRADEIVWHERLVWVEGPTGMAHLRDPLPLVLSPHPCVYRQRALRVLESIGRRVRLSYVSPSLAGAQAAVRAGLGLTVLPRDMVPAGLTILGPDSGLPALADTEIALLRAPGVNSAPVLRLAEHIVHVLGQR